MRILDEHWAGNEIIKTEFKEVEFFNDQQFVKKLNIIDANLFLSQRQEELILRIKNDDSIFRFDEIKVISDDIIINQRLLRKNIEIEPGEIFYVKIITRFTTSKKGS